MKKRLKKDKSKPLHKEKRGFEKIQTQINGYGFEYSLKKFIVTMLLCFLGMLIAGYIFKLQIVYIGIIAVVGLLCAPLIIVNQYKYIYNQNQFMQLNNYMETMILNFLERPKILDALYEAKRSAEGKMINAIDEAIKKTENGYSYNEIFKSIEKEYGCGMLYSLHKFLINIENKGGKYQDMLTAFMRSVGKWQERVFLYQKDRRYNKKIIYISIGGCCILSGLGLWMSTYLDGVMISTSSVYQIATTMMLCIFLALMTFAETKLNGSWLTKTVSNDLNNEYEQFEAFDKKSENKKSLKKCCFFIPFLLVNVFLMNKPLILITIVGMLLLYFKPNILQKKRKKLLEKEIEKQFADWLRPVALDVSTENVQVALLNSYISAPEIIKPELRKLLVGIEENPVSMEPYTQFMNKFDLPDIHRAMKIIYSINGIGENEVRRMLENLIEQNERVAEKGEEYDNETKLMFIKNVMFFPPIVTLVKLVIDLILIFVGFLSVTSSYMNF